MYTRYNIIPSYSKDTHDTIERLSRGWVELFAKDIFKLHYEVYASIHSAYFKLIQIST